MKICAISDTHNKHRDIKIPESDVLICAGDISMLGQEEIVNDFIEWFGSQNQKHKIMIFGNHEVGYSNHLNSKYIESQKLMKKYNIKYLQNSEIIIDNIKFYGSPATPYFGGLEWNYNRGRDISMIWDKIPDDTDVLITHGPAYGIHDIVYRKFFLTSNEGCSDLLNKINSLKIKAHICGHIHSGYGILKQNNTTFVNAALCDNHYSLINNPIVFDI